MLSTLILASHLVGGATLNASTAIPRGWATRDVVIDITGTANTPSKRTTYHVDLVRENGQKVGWGHEFTIDQWLGDGQRWRKNIRWMAVETDWSYHIEVSCPTHSPWKTPRRFVTNNTPWGYYFPDLYLAW